MMNRYIVIIACALLACSCGPKTKKVSETVLPPLDSLELKYAPSLAAGDAAPAFEIPDTAGKVYSLSDYKGKILVLDFWASWCRDCRAEIPAVKALYEQYAAAKVGRCPVEFLSVSFDHKEDAWKDCLRESGFSWPQVSNMIKWKENPVAQAYGLHWIPTFYVVGPDGTILGSAINSARLGLILESLTK